MTTAERELTDAECDAILRKTGWNLFALIRAGWQARADEERAAWDKWAAPIAQPAEPVAQPVADTRRECTCLGTCRKKAGSVLGKNWRCALEPVDRHRPQEQNHD